MNIFDFLTQDEIDEAPEDPTSAFTFLVRIAQGRLDARITNLREMEANNDDYDDARLGFMSTVISIGKSHAIEPFASMEVPRYEKFGYAEHRQFKGDLDHYLAQLVMSNSLRMRRDSIGLSVEAKERIRTHLHHIKVHIDKTDMPEAKRTALYVKLSDFESALEKNRLNVMAVGRVVLEILSVSCNGLALADSATLQKLCSNVMAAVAIEKAADDEQRKLPPIDPPALMLPPRREEPKPKRTTALDDFSANLDDEIPF